MTTTAVDPIILAIGPLGVTGPTDLMDRDANSDIQPILLTWAYPFELDGCGDLMPLLETNALSDTSDWEYDTNYDLQPVS